MVSGFYLHLPGFAIVFSRWHTLGTRQENLVDTVKTGSRAYCLCTALLLPPLSAAFHLPRPSNKKGQQQEVCGEEVIETERHAIGVA